MRFFAPPFPENKPRRTAPPLSRQMIMKLRLIRVVVVTTLFVVTALAQGLSDVEIEAAIKRGAETNAKKLWNQLKKKQEFRINRAGFGDPIEKKILILKDTDRIALEAADAKRQMRQVTVEEIRKRVPLGVVEILVEANCYNHLYVGSLPAWGPEGGVHLVLSFGQQVIQPWEKRVGGADAVSLLPQEHGLVTGQGNVLTYTPLYRSALYERASQRTWFMFPTLPDDAEHVIVTVISGSGKIKQKDLDADVFKQ